MKHSLYRVTSSTVSTVKVATLLIEKSGKKIYQWDVFDFESGKWTYFKGKRIARLCPTCFDYWDNVTELDHLDKCGKEVAKVQIRTPQNLIRYLQPEPEGPIHD